MKKPWDWEQTEKIHHPTTTAYLRTVYQTDISEEDFVAGYTKLPRDVYARKATNHRSPHRARYVYRRLKSNYQFFKD